MGLISVAGRYSTISREEVIMGSGGAEGGGNVTFPDAARSRLDSAGDGRPEASDTEADPSLSVPS